MVRRPMLSAALGRQCLHSQQREQAAHHQPAPSSLAAPVPHTKQRKGRVFYQLLTQSWWYCSKTVKKEDAGAAQALHWDCLGGWLKQPLAQCKDRPLHKDMLKQTGDLSWKRTSWRSHDNQKEQRNRNCCPNLSNSSSGSSELKGRVLAASFPRNSCIYFFRWISSSLTYSLVVLLEYLFTYT